MHLFNKKKLVVLLLCASSFVYADVNPFTVFNSSSASTQDQDSSQASTQTNMVGQQDSQQAATANVSTNTVPTTNVTGKNTSSPYLQPAPLTTPTTSSMLAPTNSSASSVKKSVTTSSLNAASPGSTVSNNPPLPVNRYTASQVVTSATVGLPISGSGNSNVNNGLSSAVAVPSPVQGGILQLLASINQVVGTINTNMTNWQQQLISNETQSGALLVPTSSTNLTDFLYDQSGFGFFKHLHFSSPAQSNNNSELGNAANSATQQLLAPTDLTQAKQTLGAQASTATLTNYQSRVASQYYNALVGGIPQGLEKFNLDRSNVFDAINNLILRVAMQTQPGQGDDSRMNVYAHAVNAPFIKPQGNNPSWFDLLTIASPPQILRSIAIMQAVNNQMEYQQLRNEQAALIAQAAQIAETAAVEQGLQALNQTQQQTNILLNNILNKMIEQNNKK